MGNLSHIMSLVCIEPIQRGNTVLRWATNILGYTAGFVAEMAMLSFIRLAAGNMYHIYQALEIPSYE